MLFCQLNVTILIGGKDDEAPDLTLKATSDSLGHISVRIELKADQGGADWLVAGTLVLEAGSLDMIAKSAKRFFKYKSMR